MTKDILVVTPTLGIRDTLRKTSESILHVFPDRAHHIITGPSSVRERIVELAPHSEFVPETRNEGVYAAINDMFKSRASGYKYIAYINDDDYWLPGYSNLAKILDDNSLADIAYGRTQWISESGADLGCVAHFPIGSMFEKIVAHGIPIFTQQSVLMRSSVYFELGGFNEEFKLVADTDFWIYANQRKKRIVSTRSKCAAYRIHADQLSSDKNTQVIEYKKLCNDRSLQRSAYTLMACLAFRLYNIPLYIEKFLKIIK